MTRSTESEKIVERHLYVRMKALGGKAYKWVSPGSAGVPDRICCFPDGQVELVELKGKGGSLTPLQHKKFTELVNLGKRIWVLWSRNEVEAFIDYMENGGEKGAVCSASLSGLLYQPPII